jgi:hypothetical protein
MITHKQHFQLLLLNCQSVQNQISSLNFKLMDMGDFSASFHNH